MGLVHQDNPVRPRGIDQIGLRLNGHAAFWAALKIWQALARQLFRLF